MPRRVADRGRRDVVHIYQGGAGYEVEFMTLTGETVAVVTLMASHIFFNFQLRRRNFVLKMLC